MAGLRDIFYNYVTITKWIIIINITVAFVRFAVLLLCAFLTCLGTTLIILACAVPQPKIFYPFFVFLFYVLAAVPIYISKRNNAESAGTNPCSEFAYFLTAGIILSTFALPITLARSQVISWFACNFTLAGNFINYLTMFGYVMKDSDTVYGMF